MVELMDAVDDRTDSASPSDESASVSVVSASMTTAGPGSEEGGAGGALGDDVDSGTPAGAVGSAMPAAAVSVGQDGVRAGRTRNNGELGRQMQRERETAQRSGDPKQSIYVWAGPECEREPEFQPG